MFLTTFSIVGSGKINIPIAIRFNANEDSIEDVTSLTQPSETLPNTSSAPQEHSSMNSSENWRKEFLQGGFFSRKRTISSEDLSTSAIPQVHSLPPEAVSSSLGTWKMIKGKVSQAMEDMKSSKKTESGTISDNDSGDEEHSGSENDSDVEGKQRKSGGTDGFYSKISSAKKKLSKCKISHSTDSAKELFHDSFDRDGSPLRSSFLFKKKSRASPPPTSSNPSSSLTSTPTKSRNIDNIVNDDTKMTTAPSTSVSELRRRNVADKVLYKPGNLEIESGIEITEEMSLNSSNTVETDKLKPSSQTEDTKGNETWSDEDIPPQNIFIKYSLIVAQLLLTLLRSIRFTCASIFLMNRIELSDFVRGFICSSCVSIDIYFFLKQRFGKYHLKDKVYGADKNIIKHECTDTLHAKVIKGSTSKITKERTKEHKQPLSYVGWMNEIKSYDPLNYHCSMTRTVHVKLEGSKLQLSSYLRRSGSSERVSKRAHWNESLTLQNTTEFDDREETDKKTLSLTNHRYFDLHGCQVEMLPIGLARKRYLRFFCCWELRINK